MALNNPYALSFDGVDDYAKINTAGSFMNDPGLTGELTVEFWMKRENDDSGGILSTSLTNFGRRGFSIMIPIKTAMEAHLYTASKQWAFRVSNNPVPNGVWLHHALVWDGDLLKYYIDGALLKQVGATAGTSSYVFNALMINRYNQLQSSGFLKMKLDELRVWDHARTREQINEFKNSKLTGEESGLELYCRFDTGSGNSIIDSSLNSYSGTKYGASWVAGEINLTGTPGMVLASATAHGHATASAKPIRGRGLRAAAHGMATVTARPYKIAIARAAAQGAATAKAVILVLTIPKGVYNIGDEIFNRNQPITPDSLANYIEVWVNPLKPVAEPEEVYKTDEDDPFLIDTNETKTVTIHYKKEPVTEVDIEFVNAPPYATIDSIKHYAWGANVTVTSPEAGTFELVATGKPLEVQGRELVVREDETSILENGVKKYTFDNPFVQDRATAETIAEKLLAFATPQADIEIDWRGDPALVLADPVLIPTFQRQGLDRREIFYVTKQELEFDGGLRAKLSGRKMEGGNG